MAHKGNKNKQSRQSISPPHPPQTPPSIWNPYPHRPIASKYAETILAKEEVLKKRFGELLQNGHFLHRVWGRERGATVILNMHTCMCFRKADTFREVGKGSHYVSAEGFRPNLRLKLRINSTPNRKPSDLFPTSSIVSN